MEFLRVSSSDARRKHREAQRVRRGQNYIGRAMGNTMAKNNLWEYAEPHHVLATDVRKARHVITIGSDLPMAVRGDKPTLQPCNNRIACRRPASIIQRPAMRSWEHIEKLIAEISSSEPQ